MLPHAEGRPLVLAHRGASAIAHENTIEAFRVAANAGADGVELDLRLTADDVMVVHHDPQIDGFGPIWSASFSDLRAARPHVPTLDDAYEACGQMLVNIEIKNDPAERGFDPTYRVAELLAAWIAVNEAHNRVLVSSFDRDTIGAVKEHSPAIQTGQLVARGAIIPEWMESAVDDGHEWILPHRRYLKRGPGIIDAAHQAGLRIGVWTVDSARWLRRFAEDGVDAVVTNDPGAALRIYAT